MDEEKKSSGFSPGAGVLWIAMIAAGAFFIHGGPLQGSRPAATDPKPYSYLAPQDIDARLWQDPLTAVSRGRDDVRKRYARTEAEPDDEPPRDGKAGLPTEAADHGLGHLARDVAARRPVILAVMVQGGSYAESVESRRRARYAVLAGLQQRGFEPDDAAHIGYVLPPPARDRTVSLPEFIAFEWFAAAPEARARAVGPVLVVWLDEYVFSTRTVARIEAFRRQLHPATTGADATYVEPRFVVVGPSYSSTLRDMAERVAEDPPQDSLSFYAYNATAAESQLMNGTLLQAKAELKAKAPGLRVAPFGDDLNLVQTVSDDQALADALFGELRLRGVSGSCDKARRKREHVVLIAEWDTFYGRSLPELVAREYRCGRDADPPFVHRYSYLRGLDGQLPSLEASGAPEKSPSSQESTRTTERVDVEKLIERPEGQAQLDYLRRLTYALQQMERGLEREGGGSIKAIGVLGSDVFDKLLILQALRPEFRNATFFTTNLDARMLHPQEQDWARNVVVASGFGLRLRRELQHDIPPFRDSVQTAVYLSTLIALHNALIPPGGKTVPIGAAEVARWLAVPRVYEIGRRDPFDYSLAKADPVADDARCSGATLAVCASVQPPGSPLYLSPRPSKFYFAIALVLLIAGVVSVTTGHASQWAERWRQRRALRHAKPAASSSRDFRRDALAIVGLAVLFAVVVALPLGLWDAIADYLTQGGRGEPMSLTAGVSIWPGEMIRLLALVLSVLFLRSSWAQLEDNQRAIARRLRFEPAYDVMLAEVRRDYAHWSPFEKFVRAISFRLNEYAGGPPQMRVALAWSAQLFWKKYLYQGRLKARVVRVGLAAFSYFVFASIVISEFGMPNTPYRGPLAATINAAVLGGSLFCMLLVIFFVVDATVFCCQVIDSLRDDVLGDTDERQMTNETRWAYTTIRYYTGRFRMPARHVDAWILIEFIALRTVVVSRLVYFPFIIIALMALSRNRLFDNWTMPVGLILVYGISVVIVIVCAVLLRRSAEDAREKVLARLQDDRIRLQGSGEHAAQVEAMIERVGEVRTGAFAPYSQQPIVRALAATLTALGGPALLDYLHIGGG